MQIIKDKQIIDDSWNYIIDDADLEPGDISVSLARWKKDKQQLLEREGKLGVRMGPADSVEDFAADLKDLQLIELDFPAFADGRIFSHAWLLRGRYNYQGEIRATGHYLPDQVFYLSRVGVNAFSPEKTEDLPVTLANLDDFSVKYQTSIN
ncbi:conserved hypothetical protein [Candidatus Methylobacter favarea]|uniref:DUF934 domain-containing protein n=1 Tax=Candidatus Methylobacter favarea TaxID=2707345 RepID=A0A8S0XKR5_9GAMM|nr:DUF934 domain-containing protein [Candidatus Methylobacter favarea]CAA9892242.1 conserved hypothetical protein [Candidatus Methylobacter favarea]